MVIVKKTIILKGRKQMVIVKKSSPKNLSADCRPFVGRQVFGGALLHNYHLFYTIKN